MSSIFTKIIRQELPCFKIAESEDFIAFLDVNPVAVGHTLVIPKQEIDYLFDMDNENYSNLLLFAKRVASALERNIPCKRIGMSVIGLEVPHAHVHLVPINNVGDINFDKPKLSIDSTELDKLALAVRTTFESL